MRFIDQLEPEKAAKPAIVWRIGGIRDQVSTTQNVLLLGATWRPVISWVGPL